jgi:hypothetical protein
MLIIFCIITGIIVGVAAIVLMLRSRARPRSLTIRGLGEQLGFEFSEKDNSILEKIKFFKIYNVATLQASARNVLRSKKAPPEIWVFDYESVVGAPQSSVAMVQTVFFFNDERMKNPGFRLFPVNDAITKREDTVFKYRPITFPANTGFAAKYQLTGPDEPEIRELFSPELVDYFVKQKHICVEGFGKDLLVYQPQKIVAIKDFQTFSAIAQDIFQFFLERSLVAAPGNEPIRPAR